jgi:hypothetical protein
MATTQITLFNKFFGKYVNGDKEDNPGNCDRDAAGNQEAITLEVFAPSADGKGYACSLRSYKGKFLAAHPNLNIAWHADTRQAFENWTMYILDNQNTVAFKNDQWQCWLGGDHGKLVVKPAHSTWEEFTMDTYQPPSGGGLSWLDVVKAVGPVVIGAIGS